MASIYHAAATTNKIEHTHTLQEFVALGKSVDVYDYLRFAMTEKRDGIGVVIHNVLDDYVAEMKDQAFKINLTPKQVDQYRYNPKKLSYRLYGTTTLYHIILKLNNLANVHEFSLKSGQVLLFTPSVMKSVISSIYSSERNAILTYNGAHSMDSTVKAVSNDRLMYLA